MPCLMQYHGENNVSKKILWIVGEYHEALYAARISKMLQHDYQFKITFISPFKETQRALERLDTPCSTLQELLANLANDLPERSEDQIIKANRLLRNVDINMLLHGDCLLYLFSGRKTAQTFIARLVLAYDKFLKAERFDVCLRYGGGDVTGRIPQILSERMNIGVYTLSQGTTLENCVLRWSGSNEQWSWTSFPRIWNKWKEEDLSIEKKKRVDELIQQYYVAHRKAPRTRAQQLGYISSSKLKSFLKIQFKKYRGMIKYRHFPRLNAEGLLKSGNIESLIPHWEQYQHKRLLSWLKGYATFSYDRIPDKYVYMPLNQPWDAPNRFWNPMNYLQEYIARVVFESLPAGCELVIKEHPYTYGEPSHDELKKLQKMGVRVVHPHEHSLELIKGAYAVFCVGDTSGWEGIMFRKPVIVFGASPFYVAYPYLWNVKDPNMVHHALREAIHQGSEAYKNGSLWYSFVFSAYESCYPGNVWGYKNFVWAGADASDENIEKVAFMIASEIRAH